MDHGDEGVLDDAAKQLGSDVELLVRVLGEELILLEQVLARHHSIFIKYPVPLLSEHIFLNSFGISFFIKYPVPLLSEHIFFNSFGISFEHLIILHEYGLFLITTC